MSSRPNIEGLDVETIAGRRTRGFYALELDVLSRLDNGVKVRSLRALVQTNRPRLWAKVGQNNQARRMAKSEIFTHASHNPGAHSQSEGVEMRSLHSQVLRTCDGFQNHRRRWQQK